MVLRTTATFTHWIGVCEILKLGLLFVEPFFVSASFQQTVVDVLNCWTTLLLFVSLIRSALAQEL